MSAFTVVPWANLDTITEVKLDDMVDNDQWVRRQAEIRELFSALYPPDVKLAAETVGTMRFEIGALAITSGGGGGGSTFADITGARNWDISSLTKETVQTLTIRAQGSGGTVLAQVPIFIHNDLDFLSFWAQTKVAGGDGSGYYCRSIACIGSRQDEGF